MAAAFSDKAVKGYATYERHSNDELGLMIAQTDDLRLSESEIIVMRCVTSISQKRV